MGLFHGESTRITASKAIVQDGQVSGHRVLGLGRGVEVKHCEGSVHVRLLDSGQDAICTFEQSDGFPLLLRSLNLPFCLEPVVQSEPIDPAALLIQLVSTLTDAFLNVDWKIRLP